MRAKPIPLSCEASVMRMVGRLISKGLTINLEVRISLGLKTLVHVQATIGMRFWGKTIFSFEQCFWADLVRTRLIDLPGPYRNVAR